MGVDQNRYWAKNSDSINARRREKYANDAEYREKERERKRECARRKRAELKAQQEAKGGAN